MAAKETKLFWSKIWERKEHNRKVEWINCIEKELEGVEKGPETILHLESLREILKTVMNWKVPGHDGFCLKMLTSIHDRLALEILRDKNTRVDD